MKNILPPADLFLALRYLKPKRTFVSVITLLSILGPVIGVAVLVIVTAVMSGFDRNIRERILGIQAHLQVFPPANFSRETAFIEDPAPLLKHIAANGMHGAPLIEGPILVQHRDKIIAKFGKGIDPQLERNVTAVAACMLPGKGRFEITSGQALIGSGLANELGVGIGDKILIHSPARLTKNIEWDKNGKVNIKKTDETYLPEEITIAGIFEIGVYEFDSGIVYLAQDQAADIFGLPWGSATSIQVRVPDPFDMAANVKNLQVQFPYHRFMTWQQANAQLFGALQSEKTLMLFVLFFIVLVSAFGIAGTLITAVVQKTKEIGILKAVGIPWTSIFRIFMYQGTVIGFVGTALGTGAGLLIVHYRDGVSWCLERILGRPVFPPELYHLTRIPAHLLWSDVAVIVGGSLLLCVAAAIIPALFAAALSPAEALREEN